MKILLTGGSGFFGKNLLPILQKNYSESEILAPTSSELNLLDYEELNRYFKKHKKMIVIHLAAKMSGIGELMMNPRTYLENNLIINYNVVKCCLENEVERIIVMGSSCGYNNETPLPMREDDFWKLKPENTYGISKLVMLEHLMTQKEMKWVYLVPANLYGEFDHFSDVNAHLIPATVLKFINARKKNKDYIDAWGDGSQIRDFMYIQDACDIVCRTIQDDAFCGRPINISRQQGNTVKEVIETIRAIMQCEDIEIRWDINKPIGIKEKVLCNDRLTEVMGNYKYTDLFDGLKKTIDWYLKLDN